MNRLGLDFSEVFNVLDALLHVVDALDLDTHDSIQRYLSLDEGLPVKEACRIVVRRQVFIDSDDRVLILSSRLLRGGSLNYVLLLS